MLSSLFIIISFILIHLANCGNAEYICSNFAKPGPVKLNISEITEAVVLQGHDIDFNDNEEATYEKGLVNCSWQLSVANSSSEVITLSFDEFDLPEDNCDNNYVKIFEIGETDFDAEPQLEATICGSGSVPTYESKVGQIVSLEVHIESPFRNFKIQVEKSSRSSGIGVRGAGSYQVPCDDSTNFLCPENDRVCLPKSYKCDSISDCPQGGDESTCGSDGGSPQDDSGCGSKRFINENSGSLTSLNYPCNYTNDLRCQWEITTAPGSKVLLAFNELFFIENGKTPEFVNDCPFDSLTIFSKQDGLLDTMELVGRFCGNAMPQPIVVSSNQIIINFETDSYDSASGFRLHWTTVEEDSIEQLLGTDRAQFMRGASAQRQQTIIKRFPGSKACSSKTPVTITDLKGIVTSANYGNGRRYPSRTLCHWRFKPNLPVNAKFKHFEFKFTDFDVPSLPKCQRASVKLKYFLSPSKSGVRYVFCNSQRPNSEKTLMMKAPVVEIEFNTAVKPQNTGRGFQYQFNVVYDMPASLPQPPTHPGLGPQPISQAAKPLINGPPYYLHPQPFSQANVPSQSDPQVPPKVRMIPQGQCGLVKGYTKTATVIQQESSTQFRIVGGNPAKPGQWRWPVLLSFKNIIFCGGSLIYPRWIVTAAHCFGTPGDNYHQNEGWRVVIGRHTMHGNKAWDFKSSYFEPTIQKIFVHSKYSHRSGTKLYDIALIKLDNRLPFGKSHLIMPICLPQYEVRVGKRCIVLGWGDTKGSGGEGVLKEAEVPVMDHYTCKNMNSLYTKLLNKDQMVCAGYEAGKVDACQGDSGGPLACEYRGQWFLQGIVSWGKGCAGVKAPGVYTKVISFVNWITDIVSKHSKD